MNRSETKMLVQKSGSIKAAARACGMSYSTFHDIYTGKTQKPRSDKTRPVVPAESARPPANMKSKRTLNDFRATYDKSFVVPKRVRAGLSALGAGWEYEVEFAKGIQVRLSDLGLFRDEFSGHIVEVKEGRRIWVGRTAVAQQMREML